MSTTSVAPDGSSEPDLSKSQRAYQWIKGNIGNRSFTPGYRLVLGTIAGELDMSVVPVREAIRQLEAEGLVTFERNVGAHVSMIDDSQYRYSMQTLAILEGAATALSARRITAEDIAEARAINERMTGQLEIFDPQGFTGLNKQFHARLFRACPNPRLRDLVDAEWARLAQLRSSTFAFVPGRARDSVREHENIIRLIEDSAPLEQIERAAREHRSQTLQAYLLHEHPQDAADLPMI